MPTSAGQQKPTGVGRSSRAPLLHYPILGYLRQVRDYRAVPRAAHNDAYRLCRALLSQLRRRKGLTQAALANLLGVPQSYVSKYELGERRIDLLETLEICRALDTDPVVFVRTLVKTIKSEGGRSIASPRISSGKRP